MNEQLKHAASQLAHDMESRKSVEVQVRNEITPHGSMTTREPAFTTYTDHYIEKATGERFYDFRTMKSGEVVSRSTHYGNGVKFADVDYKPGDPESQNSISISKQFWMEGRGDRRQLPQPLLSLHVGREPLHKALSSAQPLGQQEVMGRTCNMVLFTKVPWAVPQDQVFSLDEATSIPLKVEAFRDAAAREAKTPMWSWTAESLEQVQGHFVPMKATHLTYGSDGALAQTTKQEVESIAFDKAYPASQFWMEIQPGTVVNDAFTKRFTQTPGASKEPTVEKTVAASPIEATPPRDWFSVASTTTLVLGAAILLAAGLLWWRRH